MSLGAIIGGVTPGGGTVLGGINDALRNEAVRQDNSVTDAVGRGFGPGYSESFAKLAVFESTGTAGGVLGLDNLVGINTQTYDGVPLPEPTIQLDYLILQSLTEAYVDRMSPSFSFGTALTFTAGNDARQFVYSGCIIADAITGDNVSRFERAYDSALRASAMVSAERPRFVRLTFRDQIREGYITSFSASADANQRNKISFTFSMFVFNLD